MLHFTAIMSLPTMPFTIRLPHPYLTTYRVHEVSHSHAPTRYGSRLLQIRHEPRTSGKTPTQKDGDVPGERLHSNVNFTYPEQDQSADELPAESINSFWGRARRSLKSLIVWNENQRPTVAQIWMIVYSLLSLRSDLEYLRIQFIGSGGEELAELLKQTGLIVQHPAPEVKLPASQQAFPTELVLLRSAFWQGAASPFGARPVWAPETNFLAGIGLSSYPLAPVDYTTTTKFPESPVHAYHPRRPQKPKPGSVIYSRYIPHLDEHFSMLALDYNNEEHLGLFNKWQNDPFVAAGWNETGTLEEHRTYLRNLHEDPHVLTMLARFDDTCFAYFEVYWAKEVSTTFARWNISPNIHRDRIIWEFCVMQATSIAVDIHSSAILASGENIVSVLGGHR